MNILLINGSPKGDRSNTLKLSKAFLEGVLEIDKDAEIRQLNLSEKKIAPCRGCFACWNKTPGKCVMTDDMQEGIEGELWADLMIWSFPLYYFNVPGLLKNFIDRQLPMNLPFMEEQEGQTGSGGHPSRYDMSGKRHLLISTCGFYTAKNNYDSVTKLFDHVCGAGQYESIFCGQGELFRVPELKARTDEYLECVRQAGREYAQKQAISEDVKEKLRELLYPRDVFEKMADAICACLPLAAWNRKLTVYDRLSFGIVALLSVLALQKGCVNIALLAGYLGFGLMWLLSCLTKEPLCAAYVKYNYHGDDALENPIFMKANRILAAGWGILYILIAIWSAFLLPAGYTALMQILNNTATVLMGIFTGWFEKWYPQRVAAGK